MSLRNVTSRILSSSNRIKILSAQLSPQFPAHFTRRMSSLPKVMTGVAISKTGGTEVLDYKTDLPLPQPKEGEVLVKNEFVGINFIDTYFRSGLYPAPSMPYMLGREASGVIQSLGTGNTHSLAEGDRVVYLSQSTYAEYTAAPSLHCIKIPDDVSNEIAAAALLQGLTALTMIRESHLVKKGDWVLVHAAAGGVGLLLVQMLKFTGAKIVATCSKTKIESVEKHGADVVVDYGSDDFVKKVMEVTDGQGVVAVFDGVGKTTFEGSMECLARKGSMVSYGNASGLVPPVTISRLSAKNVKLIRPALFGYIVTREEFETYTKELFQFLSKDKMDVRIHEVYPLKEVARAHEDLEGRKTSGKLMLKL